MTRPRNILVILSDQQRPDTIGAYWDGEEHTVRHAATADLTDRPRGARPKTPHLDALAAQGALFERAYCAQPVCAPARASLLTGLYPHAHALQDGDVLSPEVPTLAELLKRAPGPEAGYACGYIGQWHLGHENQPQRGFEDFWVPTEDGYIRSHAAEGYTPYREYLVSQGYTPQDAHKDGFIFNRVTAACLPEEHGKPAFEAAQAIEFIERHQHRPFFLLVTFIEPHPPVIGPFDDLHDPAEMVLPATWDRDPDPTMPFRYRLRRQAVVETRKYLPVDSEASWRAYKARYWGQCSLVDKYAGRILTRLEELDLVEQTVVAYSTDHGDMMGEHRMLNKGVAYEGATRIPLIIRSPGLQQRRLLTPVSLVQLVPTLLDLAGHDVPPHLQAPSLAPSIAGGDVAPEDAEVVVEWIGRSGYPDSLFDAAGEPPHPRATQTACRTIRRWRWKLTVHASGEHQLFDVENDPGETRNLYGVPRHARITDLLYQRLLVWQRRTGDPLQLPAA